MLRLPAKKEAQETWRWRCTFQKQIFFHSASIQFKTETLSQLCNWPPAKLC